METKLILDKIQERINLINNQAIDSLKALNEKQAKREANQYEKIETMFDCDLQYYRDIARFAWAARAKQIAMVDMQSLLNELKKEISETPKNLINGDDLLFELLNNQEEIISNPRRFNGVHIDTIKNIFNKHGIIYKQPF